MNEYPDRGFVEQEFANLRQQNEVLQRQNEDLQRQSQKMQRAHKSLKRKLDQVLNMVTDLHEILRPLPPPTGSPPTGSPPDEKSGKNESQPKKIKTAHSDEESNTTFDDSDCKSDCKSDETEISDYLMLDPPKKKTGQALFQQKKDSVIRMMKRAGWEPKSHAGNTRTFWNEERKHSIYVNFSGDTTGKPLKNLPKVSTVANAITKYHNSVKNITIVNFIFSDDEKQNQAAINEIFNTAENCPPDVFVCIYEVWSNTDVNPLIAKIMNSVSEFSEQLACVRTQ